MNKSKLLMRKAATTDEILLELKENIQKESYRKGEEPIHRLRDACCQIICEKLRQIEILEKSGSTTEDSEEYLRVKTVFFETVAIIDQLEKRDFSIKEAMLVLNGLVCCVPTESPVVVGADLETSGNGSTIPAYLEDALERVLWGSTKFYLRRTIFEIKDLELVDKVAEVQQRLVKELESPVPTGQCYVDALEVIEAEPLASLDIEKFRRKNRKKAMMPNLETSSAAGDRYHPENRELTRQLAMLLIDELFPILKSASNKAKAEFLELLTGFDADGLRNKWVDYQRGNAELLARDRAKVAEWKKS